MKRFVQILIVGLAMVSMFGCSTFHGNVPSPGKTVVKQESGYANAFDEIEKAKPLPPALIATAKTEQSTMMPAARPTKNSIVAAIKSKLNGKKVVKKAPVKKIKVLNLESVMSYARANRGMILQNSKAIEELSLMVVLNRYMIEHGKGVVIPLRYFFASGGSKLSKTANKDINILCLLSKEKKVEVALVEGYSDDAGSYDKNEKLTWQRVDAVLEKLKCQDNCANPINPLTAAYAETNFQGSKQNNRSVIIYVKILQEIDIRKFSGNTVPSKLKK